MLKCNILLETLFTEQYAAHCIQTWLLTNAMLLTELILSNKACFCTEYH